MKGTEKLQGVNQILIDFIYKLDYELAKSILNPDSVEITISEGLRSIERQKELFKQGKSKTLKSKHLIGDAIDIYPIKNNKIDWEFYPVLMKIAKETAAKYNFSLNFGIDFKTFKDSPHIEIK